VLGVTKQCCNTVLEIVEMWQEGMGIGVRCGVIVGEFGHSGEMNVG